LFIAEIGINHNGDLGITRKLIYEAKRCGADVVKFQKRNPELCVPEDQKHLIKDCAFGRMEYIEYRHKIEFGKKEYDEIDKYCKEQKIPWTASVWDVDSLHFMSNYDVPFIKVPSACITNLTLLKSLNESGMHVIISTGMSTEDEIDQAVRNLNNLVGILHCNSSYPCKSNETNLYYIKTLKARYGEYKIGYSGHEQGVLPTILAKALGSEIIERHITLNKQLPGSDHLASLDISELEQLIKTLNLIDEVLGDNRKVLFESEKIQMKKLRMV